MTEKANALHWRFEGDGSWWAASEMQDSGHRFIWRIAVCDDGTFSVDQSDAELTESKETFDTLKQAKAWCEEREREFREGERDCNKLDSRLQAADDALRSIWDTISYCQTVGTVERYGLRADALAAHADELIDRCREALEVLNRE